MATYNSVQEYIEQISLLQTEMHDLIVSEGGSKPANSLEQYMQSLVDLRKKFVELLASFGVEASESEKMSPAWVDKFNTLIFNLVKGYDLTDLEIVDDTTKTIAEKKETGYGTPHIKKLTFNNLQTINSGAFRCCYIDEIIFNGLTNIYGDTLDTFYPQTPVFPANAYVKKISMPDITFINANSVFQGNTTIQEISIPNVKVLKRTMFSGCTSLKIVNLDSFEYTTDTSSNPGVKTFYNCSALETINLPKLQYMKSTSSSSSSNDGQMFGNCKALKTAYFESLKSIYDNARPFYNCSALEEVYIPNCTKIGYRAFYQCSALKNVSIDNVINLGSNAFFQCSNINIKDWLKLETIANETISNIISSGNKGYSFSNCTKLTEFNAPILTIIGGNGVFNGCSALISANLGLIDNLPANTFNGCTSLTDVYLGYDGVVSLANVNAFNSATATKPVTLHVKPDYADSYATATNWSSLIAQGKIIIVGDYSD